MNKGSNENYTGLKEDVRSFIVSFYEHVKEQNVVEVENDCQIQYVLFFFTFCIGFLS